MTYKKEYMYIALFIHLLIFFNSMIPGTLSAQQSGIFSDFLVDTLALFRISLAPEYASFFIRKLAHFIQFAVLAIFWFLYFEGFEMKKTALLYTVIIGFVTGVLDETLQIFIIGRVFSLLDIGIDWLGVLAGGLTLYLIKQKKSSITLDD